MIKLLFSILCIVCRDKGFRWNVHYVTSKCHVYCVTFASFQSNFRTFLGVRWWSLCVSVQFFILSVEWKISVNVECAFFQLPTRFRLRKLLCIVNYRKHLCSMLWFERIGLINAVNFFIKFFPQITPQTNRHKKSNIFLTVNNATEHFRYLMSTHQCTR